jgi:hypothetical protein
VAEQSSTNSQSLKDRVRQLERKLAHLTGCAEGDQLPLPNEDGHDRALEVVAKSSKSRARVEAVDASNEEAVAGPSLFGLEPLWNTPISPSSVFHYGVQTIPGGRHSMYEAERPSPIKAFILEPRALGLPAEQVQICWPIFLENIDPLVKVLHIPSAENLIRSARHRKHVLSKGEQALLHAICFSTISSMTVEDAETCFQMPKAAALATYRSTTEQALMEANFLITDDLVTLQALVLFLWFCPYVDEAKLAWSLIGTAARLSSVGLYMLPFEKEMRRRLVWHLWYLDNRAKQELGQDSCATVSIVDIDMPLNVNDIELDPHMAILPTPRNGWTAVSFSVIRFELALSNAKLESDIAMHQKETMINDLQNKLKSTYLRYCGQRNPIHWLAGHVTDVHIAEMWFKLYGRLPNSPTATHHVRATRDRLFLLATDIVDMARDHGLEPEAQKWKWNLKGYHQYLPLAFLLTELCHRPDSDMVNRAWRVVERAYLRWGGEIQESKHHGVLKQLMNKAKAHRNSFQQMQPLESHLPGHYLTNLPNIPDMNANALIRPTIHSINDLPTFLVEDLQLNTTELPSLNEDIPMFNSSEHVTEFAPDPFDATDWSNMAQYCGTMDDEIQDFELGHV